MSPALSQLIQDFGVIASPRSIVHEGRERRSPTSRLSARATLEARWYRRPHESSWSTRQKLHRPSKLGARPRRINAWLKIRRELPGSTHPFLSNFFSRLAVARAMLVGSADWQMFTTPKPPAILTCLGFPDSALLAARHGY